MEQGNGLLASVDLAGVIGTADDALRPLTVEKKVRIEEPPAGNRDGRGRPGEARGGDESPRQRDQVFSPAARSRFESDGGDTAAGGSRSATMARARAAVPESLFERFRQGAPSPHSQSRVSAGLFVVKSCLDLMGGTATADPRGGGAEFTVGLPVPGIQETAA
jgi:hypothetical protein